MRRIIPYPTMRYRLLTGLMLCLLVVVACTESEAVATAGQKVRMIRTPNNGIQPQAIMDEHGVLHLIYFSGDPAAGNIFYVRREPGKESFSSPIQVNSQSGSAIAIGTMRGAHLSIGKAGRVHVSWNGSGKATPRAPDGGAPMLYARMNDAKTAFEAQRNVMQISGGLDGGGSVAADQSDNIYVTWHGSGGSEGEAHRRVWIARSTDEGKTFAREAAAFSEETGACGCCGMRVFVDRQGRVQVLYRAATDAVNRGMVWLTSNDQGNNYRGNRLDEWQISTCPMSSATIANGLQETVLAWENQGQVYYTTVPTNSTAAKPVAAPGQGGGRKHPSIASNPRGETILVWVEGTGWKKGGTLAWQVFDKAGKPTAEKGEAPGVPVWGLATVVAEKDGRFSIIY